MSWTITGAEKFQPTVGQDSLLSSVSLLLYGNGTNGSQVITDSSPTPKTVTANGNAQLSTAEKKFGSSSILLDGTDDYISVSGAVLPSGTGDFTIECWIKLATTNTAYPLIRTSDGNRGIKVGGGSLQFYMHGFSGQINVAASYSATTNWQHIAFTRADGVIRLFADGSLLANDVINANPGTGIVSMTSFDIGRKWTDSYLNDFNGYIDDFRITLGAARYTTSFTPTTTSFPDI